MKVFIDTFFVECEGCEDIDKTWLELVGLNHGIALCKADDGYIWSIPCDVIRSFEQGTVEGATKYVDSQIGKQSL